MRRLLRFILTLALLSVVAHPAGAQEVSGPVFLVLGGSGESFELAFFLDPRVAVGGMPQVLSPAECTFRRVVEFQELTGGAPDTTILPVELAAGQTVVVSTKFHDDSSVIRVAVKNPMGGETVGGNTGPCVARITSRQVDSEGRTTGTGGPGAGILEAEWSSGRVIR